MGPRAMALMLVSLASLEVESSGLSLCRSQGGHWRCGPAWSVAAIHTNQMHPHDSALIVAFFFFLTLSGFCFFKTVVSGPCVLDPEVRSVRPLGVLRERAGPGSELDF